MVASGLSPTTVRKAVFALRQCLAAAVSDRRLALMCRALPGLCVLEASRESVGPVGADGLRVTETPVRPLALNLRAEAGASMYEWGRPRGVVD